ncbi:MAG: hypothetical protein PHP98_08760 [Kiritimatiellae bacterium]|nr:hypothetical protein [Kiritimatiellia bacterium]
MDGGAAAGGPWLAPCGLAALLAALGLMAAGLIFGNLNQDEGWYLYAAGLISSGKIPYRDFAFTQGPVMPFVYALADPLVKWGGLAAGRVFTGALGLAGAILAAWLAGRLARPGQKRPAVILCFILALVNIYQGYFCTVVKTYSLTILFLIGGFLTLHHALARRRVMALTLSAALFVLAAGVRSSAAVVPLVIFCLLWLERGKFLFPAWIYFAAGGIITAISVFGPFLAQCAANFIYFVVSYHALRDENGFLQAMAFKAGFISRFLQAYFVCFVFWAAALAAKRFRKNDFAGEAAHDFPISSFLRRCVWLSALAVSLLHLAAPFPYDDYQVFVYPLFATAVTLMVIDVLPARAGTIAVLTALVLSCAAAVSSPVNQDWFIEGRELIWWKTRNQPPLVKLRQTAARVRALTNPEDFLLTQDPYLAVESGRPLPPGLEMGQFSYFPDLTDEQAKKLNVLNRNLFAELLRNCGAPLAALSGYAFAIQSPQITPLRPDDRACFERIIHSRYELLETIPHFGQAATDLRLYRRMAAPGRR